MSQPGRATEACKETNQYHILVVTENQLVRFGIGTMLKSLPVGYQEICTDVKAGLRQIRSSWFNVLILSASLDDEQCALFAAEAAGCDVKVLLLVDSREPECALRMSKLPADGFLLQDELTLEVLNDALYRIMRGELPMPTKLARELLTHVGRGEPGVRRVVLTPREREILAMLVQGMSNKQIARRLGITVHGSKRHVATVLAKLNCPNRTMAATLAIQAGLLAEANS